MPEREQSQHLALALGKRVRVGGGALRGLGSDEPRAESGVDVSPTCAISRTAETTSSSAASLRT